MKGELQLLNIKGNMIKEFEFYHGVILAKLVHGINTSVLIQTFPSRSNSSYIVNKNIGLFIKYSTKRMSPWRFSFAKDHQDEILNIKNTLGEVFTLLGCGEDGVVCLSFDDLKKILNETHDQTEWISVSRGRNKEYTIKGTDGSLRYKISKTDFPKKLFENPIVLEEIKKRKIFSWFN